MTHLRTILIAHYNERMKTLTLVLTFCLALHASVPAPLDYVDPLRFGGLWYEIARTDNPYERDCVAATVEYTHIEGYEFRVDNRCFEGEIGGARIHYQGRARAADEKSFARIDMTYFWIFSREYRVIYLDEDYESAVVSDEAMAQVWIVHRAPFMDQHTLADILSFLEPYRLSDRLIWTPQDKQGRYQ